MPDTNDLEPVPVEAEQDVHADAPLLEEDLIIEDVSIDGMCGVY